MAIEDGRSTAKDLLISRDLISSSHFGGGVLHNLHFAQLAEVIYSAYYITSNLTTKRYGLQTSIEINDKFNFSQKLRQ